MTAHKLIPKIVGIACLVTAFSAAAADKLGKVEPAKKLIDREVQISGGQKVGQLNDLVVDLESGRILYGIVSQRANELIALPPDSFTASSQTHLTVNADKEKMTGAPRFTKDHEAKLGDAEFVKQLHQHFGTTPGWEGSFNNVHKATELAGMNVKNVSDQSLGEISDLGIDLQSGRVAFAILKAGGLGAGGKLYAVPPNAFTAASDNQSLVANIDKEKLANAPQVAANNWQQLSDAAFAARVYQYYGKQPYWSGTVSPTGGAESRVYKDQNRTTNSRPASQKASGEFASVEEAKRLIGMNVENARGADVAKLNDIVVDLESGRAIYALVDLSGRGGIKAVPSSSLMLAPNDKSLRFTGDQAKLNNAPALNRNANVADAQFAERVYTHFGEDHAWFDSSRNFATAHKVTDLMKMKVENVQNQNVGQVQNLMVDLPNARVLYVILSAAPIVGNGNSLFALPPNAFTASEERKTLVSDLDKAKLEGAPRFNRTNLRELANPAKAAEIYQYYGKQAYWDSGNLAPTGREQGRENE